MDDCWVEWIGELGDRWVMEGNGGVEEIERVRINYGERIEKKSKSEGK